MSDSPETKILGHGPEKHDRQTTQGKKSASGVRGFALSLLVLVLPLLPLLFHRSETAHIASYSRTYFFALLGLASTAVCAAIVLGFVCRRRGDLRIAQMTVFVVVTCLAILMVGEIVSRWVMPEPFAKYRRWGHRKSVLFGFEATPNKKWSFTGTHYSTDSHGFRTRTSHVDGNEQSPGQEEMRVFAIGASSVFGFGLEDDETWPHLLEHELRQMMPGRQIKVINAGNSGHNSLQTLMRFYLRVLPQKPDYVLYYQSRNDVKEYKKSIDDAVVVEDVLFSTTHNDYVQKRNRGKNFYVRTNLGSTLDETLSKAVASFGHEDKSQVEGEQASGALTEREAEATKHNGRIYIRNVQSLADICGRNGVKLILMTFIHDDENMKPRYWTHSIKEHNRLLRELAGRERIPLIDLEDVFAPVADKAPYFMYDSYHPTRTGAEFIAKETAGAFDRILGKMTDKADNGDVR